MPKTAAPALPAAEAHAPVLLPRMVGCSCGAKPAQQAMGVSTMHLWHVGHARKMLGRPSTAEVVYGAGTAAQGYTPEQWFAEHPRTSPMSGRPY